MDISVAESDYVNAIKSLVTAQYDVLYTKCRILGGMGSIYSSVIENTGEAKYNYNDDIIDWNGVYESLLEVSALTEQEETIVPKPDTEEPLKCYIVNANNLNIREVAHIGSPVVGRYANGTNVCGKETKDKWLKTSKGWVSLDYLILVD